MDPGKLLSSIADTVIVTDATGRITYANPALHTLLGWAPKEALGKPLELLMPERMREAHGHGFTRFMTLGTSRIMGKPVRVPALHREGHEVEIELTLATFEDEGQTLVVGTIRDLADRVELERELQAATHLAASAERAVQLRDEFFTVASHELRTPVAALSLITEHLTRLIGDTATAKVEKRLAGLARQVRRLDTLVAGLLDTTRFNLGKVALRRERFDLGELCRDVADRFEGEEASTGSTIERDIAAGLIGHWDAGLVDQVVMNLLANALKFGRGRPVKLQVSGDQEHAVVEVEDQGIGIGASELERVFGRFERAVPVETYSGIGLGLWLSRRIAEAHGGTLTVQSALGSGSAFRFELPLGSAGVEAAAEPGDAGQ